MRHIAQLSRSRLLRAVSPLETKTTTIINVIDRLLLMQRQSAWKVPFPIEGTEDTDTGGTGDTGGGGTIGM